MHCGKKRLVTWHITGISDRLIETYYVIHEHLHSTRWLLWLKHREAFDSEGFDDSTIDLIRDMLNCGKSMLWHKYVVQGRVS